MNYPYYNPYYPAPMQDNLAQLRQLPMQQQSQSMMQWVNGEQDARAYLVAPNSAVALWDSSRPVVYLKQSDASGRPTLRIYDLVERTDAPVSAQSAPEGEYITRKEFDALAALVGELKEQKPEIPEK